MKQLVLRGNRILAYGEDCFFCMGGSVICTKTGRVFDNATVTNVTGEIPANIDSAGYEYHAGEFVPCAPYGVGDGNIAVVCNEDCKSIKDSAVSLAYMLAKPNVYTTNYNGVDVHTDSNSDALAQITLPFAPKIVFIMPQGYRGSAMQPTWYMGVLLGSMGVEIPVDGYRADEKPWYSSVFSCDLTSNTITWGRKTSGGGEGLCGGSFDYTLIALG